MRPRQSVEAGGSGGRLSHLSQKPGKVGRPPNNLFWVHQHVFELLGPRRAQQLVKSSRSRRSRRPRRACVRDRSSSLCLIRSFERGRLSAAPYPRQNALPHGSKPCLFKARQRLGFDKPLGDATSESRTAPAARIGSRRQFHSMRKLAHPTRALDDFARPSYQYCLRTLNTGLVVPSGRTTHNPRHWLSLGRSGFPVAVSTGAACPLLSAHSLSYTFHKNAP